MATSEERTLENAIITALQALTYITAQSIPVRNWDDQDDARAFPCVMVRVAPRVRIAPNANYYRFPVEVVGARHRGDDPNQSTLDQLYNEIADWAYARGNSLSFGDDKTLVGVGAASDATMRTTNGDGNAWTFACKIKPVSGNTQTILMAGDYATGGWVEFNYTALGFVVRYGDATGFLTFTAAGLTVGAWNHVICTFDGGTTGDTDGDIDDYYSRFGFWINGVSVSPTKEHANFGYTGDIGSTHFIVGGTNSGQYLQSGFELDNLALWNSDETANVLDIYSGGASINLSILASAPQFYYRFKDRASPTTSVDTMAAKNLTAVGFVASDYAEVFNTIGINADGITYNDGIEDVEDSIHHRGVSFDIYDTIA